MPERPLVTNKLAQLFVCFPEKTGMETSDSMLQDLSDLLHINSHRADAYNKCAYLCEDMQLKMLLNREVDNCRDHVLALKRAIHDRFDGKGQLAITGQLFNMWSDSSPSFHAESFAVELSAFETSDFLVLQCYLLVLSRPYLDSTLKLLLECQCSNSNTIYSGMKAFNESFATNEFRNPGRKSA
jgi:hypothetical protein